MSYNVVAVPKFKKQLKKLALKYPSLKEEFGFLIETLETDPEQGTSFGKIAIRFGFPSNLKEKGKVVELGSLLIL